MNEEFSNLYGDESEEKEDFDYSNIDENNFYVVPKKLYNFVMYGFSMILKYGENESDIDLDEYNRIDKSEFFSNGIETFIHNENDVRLYLMLFRQNIEEGMLFVNLDLYDKITESVFKKSIKIIGNMENYEQQLIKIKSLIDLTDNNKIARDLIVEFKRVLEKNKNLQSETTEISKSNEEYWKCFEKFETKLDNFLKSI